MQKIVSIIIILILTVVNLNSSVFAATASADVKAVWMATIFNIDFPSSKSDVAAQKNEYINKLDKLAAAGINTIVVQIRPKADALYKSEINPWSDVLTGTQGKDPGYDPLSFMIGEAHKRGISFYAWLNPYRITTVGTSLTSLYAKHPARKHPDWVLSYNNALFYNPESQGVKTHIVATVSEIVKNYDVDAIVFDDYFYPSNYPLPPGEGKDGAIANNRRQSINDLIQRVSAVIKSSGKTTLFVVSPTGIWKNKTSDLSGSDTTGNQSYYSVYADTRTWIKNNWIDYVVPQIYWQVGHKGADYETLVKWWSNEVKGSKVKLSIGQGIYNELVAKEIDVQLKINQKYPEVQGSFYYGMKNLLANTAGCREKISKLPQSQVALRIGTVTATVLNIRSGGGLQYSVVNKVVKGAKVTILNSQAGWYCIRLANGQTGWASEAHIKQ
ncbi:MAG: family 10 glycosylhydrolase [Peptococcaceae bacterium]|nr:family 10 glycosylhydrolase [Peptococcaceae bacterium]